MAVRAFRRFSVAASRRAFSNSVPQQRIKIYDTTLRDGTQGEGVSLSLHDKLAIAERLDDMGFDFIEGGFPMSNEKDALVAKGEPFVVDGAINAFGWCARASRLSLCA